MGSMAGSTVENDGTPDSNGNLQPKPEYSDDNDSPLPGEDSSGNPLESDGSRKRKSAGVLPLEVGTRVMCRWRDGKYHPVKVIERRKMQCGGPNDYEYYVHYTECSAGISFTPHIITVKAGEDVASTIMAFSQQGPRAVCILSANGAISNVTLRQPATSGGTVSYEEIVKGHSHRGKLGKL